MKLSLIFSAAALALGSVLAAPAQAITITNTDFPAGLAFTGFDLSKTGTAFTTGFQAVTGTNFDLTVFAITVSLTDTFGNPVIGAHMDTSADGVANPVAGAAGAYEYTFVGVVHETVTGCSASIPATCTFSINGGTFAAYYGAANANATAGSLGTGFTDGTQILAGSFTASAFGGSFTATSGASGTGSSNINGVVTSTNSTYINPALSGTQVTTTLQIGPGSQSPAYANPGGFGGTAFSSLQTSAQDRVFQADANADVFVTAVPEPTSIALVGAALVGLGMASRRRKSK